MMVCVRPRQTMKPKGELPVARVLARLPGRRQGHDDSTWLFGLFGLLLALSLILHQLWWDGFEIRSPHFLVMVAALWTARRPTSVKRFVTMIATEVFAVAVDLPNVGDHTLLVAVSGVFVLTYVAWTTLRTRRLPDPGILFEQIAPFFALHLLLVYAAAAIAKMNTGFFDPGISCAASMSTRLPWLHPSFLPESWIVVASIWGTVAVEVALPVLLAFRRSRLFGLALGGAFHAVLGLAGNVPFSALALALYVMFLPPDTPTRLRAITATRPGLNRWARRALRAGRSRFVVPCALAFWLVGASVSTHIPGTRPALISLGTSLLLVVAFAGGLLLVLGLARGGSGRLLSRSLRLRNPVFVAGMLVLLVNSLSPYVGLKTESSFTMFSNLRTEAGRWNHLLIPEAVRIFPYQDHLVRIIASDDRALEATTRNGWRLVPSELERYLRAHPGTTATYVTTDMGGDAVHTVGPGSGSKAVPTTRVLDRVVRFQAVPPPDRGGC